MALRRVISSRLAALSAGRGGSLLESGGHGVAVARSTTMMASSSSSSSSGSFFSTSPALPPREVLEFDVVIVGGGPAGLAAALRLKQRASSSNVELSVAVLEKGAALGAHTLSGAAVDPRSLVELLGEDWATADADARAASGVAVVADRFLYLSERAAWRLPTPPQMSNRKCKGRVLSLSELVRYLGKRAEEAGVDVLPGFAASALLLEEDRSRSRGRGGRGGGGGSSLAVAGVVTGDVGIAKDGASLRRGFSRGVEVRARATLLAEGARGSLTQQAERAFGLREQGGADGAGAEPQTYALGLKEVWSVSPEKHSPGTAWHTVGFPLPSDTYGGGFLYHLGEEEEDREGEEGGGSGSESESESGGEGEAGGAAPDDAASAAGAGKEPPPPPKTASKPCRVSLGLVVGLDYKDPTLNPYQEFQRFKSHPKIRELLQGGTCTSYGARTLNEGGWQSLPRLDFPGGALLGCAAGTLVVPRIKGVHTAVASGMQAAEAVFDALRRDDELAREAEERRARRRAEGAAEGGEGGEEELLFSGEDDGDGGEEAGGDGGGDDLSKPYVRPALDLSDYDRILRESWVGRELEEARNIRPGFHLGLWPGMVLAALDTFLLRGRGPWTLRHGLPEGGDRGATRPLAPPPPPSPSSSSSSSSSEGAPPPATTPPPRYPPPDNEVTFPLSEALSRSGVDHDHDQPSHLRLKNAKAASAVSAAIFGGPEARYCPAGVYEYVDRRLGPAATALGDPWEIARVGREGEAELRVNAQNCLHCKACDIKEPAGNIVWSVPEGGGGPNYTEM